MAITVQHTRWVSLNFADRRDITWFEIVVTNDLYIFIDLPVHSLTKLTSWNSNWNPNRCYTLKKMVTCTVMEHVHSKLHWCVAFKTKTQNRELNSKQQTAVASFYQQRKRGLNEENESWAQEWDSGNLWQLAGESWTICDFFLQSLKIGRSIFDNSQKGFKDFHQLSKITQWLSKIAQVSSLCSWLVLFIYFLSYIKLTTITCQGVDYQLNSFILAKISKISQSVQESNQSSTFY